MKIDFLTGMAQNAIMDLTKITSEDFKKIAKLLKEKDALLEKIASIDAALAQIQGGRKRVARKGVASQGGGARSRSRSKDAIVAELQTAGSEGVAVKDLAAKLNKKPANLHAWFLGTGKRVAEIKKIGPGRYAWQS